MSSLATMPNVSKISRVSEKLSTLRTTIPKDLSKQAGLSEGDVLVWEYVTVNGKKGLFARKAE